MRTRILVGSLLLALPLVVLAQPAQPDTLTALLNEVRQLRLALERTALTGPQIQLLSSRLTIQNERVSRATRDLDAAQVELARASDAVTRLAAGIQGLEQAPASTPSGRKAMETELAMLNQQLENLTAEEQRARQREGHFANLVASEQLNWAELNRRLDEVERALATPPASRK